MIANPPTPAPETETRGFKREMTLFDSMMIVMGAMIGSSRASSPSSAP